MSYQDAGRLVMHFTRIYGHSDNQLGWTQDRGQREVSPHARECCKISVKSKTRYQIYTDFPSLTPLIDNTRSSRMRRTFIRYQPVRRKGFYTQPANVASKHPQVVAAAVTVT